MTSRNRCLGSLLAGAVILTVAPAGGCTSGVSGGPGGLGASPSADEDGGGSTDGTDGTDGTDHGTAGTVGADNAADGSGDAGEACPGGTVDCDGMCADLPSDPEHCGGCNVACGLGESCEGGSCMGAPADACAGDPCNGHGWCSEGLCICDPGYAGGGCTSCDGIWQAVPGAIPIACEPTITISGTAAGDDLDGQGDDEKIQGLDGDDNVSGMDGQDYVNGNAGADFVNGNVGRDAVHGGSGNDQVHGGAGDDLVVGGGGNDNVFGGGGDDRLIGGDGDDYIDGGDGDDRYVIDGLGHDTFDDPVGNDTARCIPGVTVVGDAMAGGDRVLSLSTGGTVTIMGDRVESVLGC